MWKITELLSFTVDPAFDDPQTLQTYLDQFAPTDPSKWEMLTGYRQEKIMEIAKK